jgi:RNA polymerase sigma-70 factor (ECF subfamily)
MSASGGLTDEEVVGKVLSGYTDSYRLIVERYEKKLERYVKTIAGPTPDLDDIVQNVFIKAYRNLTAFDRKLKFSSWIYRIAHNESINHVRSSFVQKFVLMGEWFDHGEFDDTEEKIDRELERKRLEQCLEKLDIKYREPMSLFYWDEKTYEEISDILRIPVRAVGVRIHRGRELLRRLCHE